MILTYQYLIEKRKFYYDKKEVRKLLIRSKKSKSLRITRKNKEILFILLSNIVIKNIENFFNYCKQKGYKELIHERDDLVGESFMVLDKCIEKYDLQFGTIFYWYYNRALSNRMLRIIERTYYKSRNSSRIPEGSEYYMETKQTTQIKTDFTDILFKNCNISETEKKIIEAKMQKSSIKDLLEKDLMITSNEYYKIVNKLKNKLSRI